MIARLAAGIILFCFATQAPCLSAQPAQDAPTESKLVVRSLPDLPDEIGMAGPIVGVHNNVLIVAGGANFSKPDDPGLFDLPKQYHDRVWIMQRSGNGKSATGEWRRDTDAFRLQQPIGYSSVVSTQYGVLCAGGENEQGATNRAFLLSWRPGDGQGELIEYDDLVPDLPLPCTAGGAALIGNFIYVVAGQVTGQDGVRAASRLVWRIEANELDPDRPRSESVGWQPVVSWPAEGHRRMFPLVTSQHDGFTDRLFVMGGRHFRDNSDTADLYNLNFSSDCWSFDPTEFDPDKFNPATGEYSGTNPWHRISDCPVPVSAGTAVPYGPAHIIVPAYASGDILKRWLDSSLPMSEFIHPGFPRRALAYHTVTDTWTTVGQMPAGQVTSPAVRWGDEIILVSGEVRPRVRTRKVWSVRIPRSKINFGWLNMSVVIVYLLSMLGIGVWFSQRNKSTDDYFRGGKSIPWWAAGCSIFATMLSSITYMAVPAKAFAQNWVYAVGNLLILAVAPLAIYVVALFSTH